VAVLGLPSVAVLQATPTLRETYWVVLGLDAAVAMGRVVMQYLRPLTKDADPL
jgi:hypothetical protein